MTVAGPAGILEKLGKGELNWITSQFEKFESLRF